MAQGSERELVERATQGDLDAVEELLARHARDLEGFVRRRAGGLPSGKESASDLVQSVCREILEDLRDERFEYRGPAEFRAWMYEAATLKIRDRRRYWAAERRDPGRERREDAELGGAQALFPGRSTTPSADVARSEESSRARELLKELPERYRRVIELAHIEGRPHREVAELLEISESASRMLLSRALARFAKIVDREP